MTRYYALMLTTLDMGYVPPHESEPWGRYEVVMADEADAAIDELREALSKVMRDHHYEAWEDGEEGSASCWHAIQVLAKYEEEA